MLSKCPKCGSKTVHFENVLGERYNQCALCGFLHIPGSSLQSFERQVTGKNDKYGVGDMKAQFEIKEEN